MDARNHETQAAPTRFADLTFWAHVFLVLFLLVALFHPLIFRGQIPGDMDNLFYFYPQRALIHQGEALFWNPYQFAGLPAYRDPQLSLFYPPSWLYRFLPLDVTFVVMILGHYLFAAVGFLWLGFLFRLPRVSRLLGCLAFVLGSYMLGRFLNHSLLVTAAYAPWIFGSFHRAIESRSGRWLVVAGFFQALQILAGMPHNAGFMMMALAGYATCQAVAKRSLHPFLIGAGVVCVAGGLSAVQLVPTYWAVGEAVRRGQTYAQAGDLSLPLNWIPEFLLGGTDRPGEGINEFLATTCYVGVGTVVLIPFAFWHRRRDLAVYLIVLAFAAFLLALGPAGLVHRWFFHLPGGKFFNIPGRFLFLSAWGLPLLGALGLARLLDRRDGDIWIDRLLGCFFAGGIVLLLVLSIGHWAQLWTAVLRPWAAAGESFMLANLAVFGALSGGFLFGYRMGKIKRTLFSFLFIGVLVLDLLHFSTRLKREYVSSDYFAPTQTIEEAQRLARGSIRSRVFGYQGGFGRKLSSQEAISPALIVPKAANLHRLEDIQGFSPLHTFRYNQTLRSAAGMPTAGGALRWVLIGDARAPIIDLLGVRYMLGEPHDRLVHSGVKILKSGEGLTFDLSGWNRPVREILLISCLDYGSYLPQGEQTGTITIRGASGERRVLPIRAGIETADFRLAFPDVPKGHRAARIHTTVRCLLPSGAASGQVYACRISFDPVAEPAELTIRHGSDTSILVLREVLLTAVPYEHLRQVFESGGIRLYENRRSFPRAWWVGDAVSVRSNDDAIDLVVAGDSDFGSTIIVESPSAGEERKHRSVPRTEWTDPLAVEVVEWRPGRVEVNVSAPADGYLVVSEMDDVGWQVSVDGTRAPRLRANALMMATPVAAGTHRVLWRFVPLDAYLGGGITFLTVVIVIAGLGLSRRRAQVNAGNPDAGGSPGVPRPGRWDPARFSSEAR